MEKSNYDLVLEIIKSYEDEKKLEEFLSKFEVGKNISYEEYCEFCISGISDCSDWYYISLNWEYIESGGDESVYDKEI